MKGFYLNCKKDKALEFVNKIECAYRIDDLPQQFGVNGFIINDPFEWKESPIYQNDERNIFCACYGWIIYKNKKNNISEFANDFSENRLMALKEISGGLFIIVLKSCNELHIINDPFGTSNHYYRKENDIFEVAPSPYFLGGEKNISKTANSIMRKLGHLFGDMTLFVDIKRINPASIFNQNHFESYYLPEIRSFNPEKVVETISHLVNFWNYDSRGLALSGGLDSRLILACSKFKNGYTFGPEKSGDRSVAAIFRNEFENYYGFSILNLKYYKKDIQTVKDIFTGLCPTPISALFPIYRHVRNHFGDNAYVAFDGYLGDVLQRGSLLNINKGILGYFLKAFPSFTFKISVEKILKERYKSFDENEFDILLKDFRKRTKNLLTDDYHKLLYYEFAFVRGRLAANGGIVMNSQFFTVVSPFTYIPLFENLFSADLSKTLSFKTVQKIWKRVEKKYSTAPTQSIFSPVSSPFLIRYQRLYSRLLSKLFHKKNISYAGEINKIEWL